MCFDGVSRSARGLQYGQNDRWEDVRRCRRYSNHDAVQASLRQLFPLHHCSGSTPCRPSARPSLAGAHRCPPLCAESSSRRLWACSSHRAGSIRDRNLAGEDTFNERGFHACEGVGVLGFHASTVRPSMCKLNYCNKNNFLSSLSPVSDSPFKRPQCTNSSYSFLSFSV